MSIQRTPQPSVPKTRATSAKAAYGPQVRSRPSSPRDCGPELAIFITWDDWGGWWDHVTPLQVETWTDGTQFRYGGRVGCIVLSPYARKGYVSKALHSHVSLVKFCEWNFGLPSLNLRTTAADAMEDCFDFEQPPLPPPQ